MQLDHSFSVPVGIDAAWQLLSDIGSASAYLPGSTIAEAGAEHAAGSLKVKLGPLNLTYRGSARLVGLDAGSRRAVLEAAGEDARNGSAAATVTLTLEPAGDTTTVAVVTDLDVTGKPAGFGRGVMADVGTKLVAQFAANLATALDAGALPVAGADAASAASEGGTDVMHEVPKEKKSKPRPKPRKVADQDAAVTEAATTEPTAAEPATTEPLAAEPATTEPPAAEPATTEPPAAEPEAGTARPLGTDALDAVDDDADPVEIAEATAATDGEPDAEPAADLVPDPEVGPDDAAFGPGSAAPVFAVPDLPPAAAPVGAVSPGAASVNGHGSPTPAPATSSLIDSARPVIARGLAPVALAVVLVLGAARRRRGKRG